MTAPLLLGGGRRGALSRLEGLICKQPVRVDRTFFGPNDYQEINGEKRLSFRERRPFRAGGGGGGGHARARAGLALARPGGA